MHLSVSLGIQSKDDYCIPVTRVRIWTMYPCIQSEDGQCVPVSRVRMNNVSGPVSRVRMNNVSLHPE